MEPIKHTCTECQKSYKHFSTLKKHVMMYHMSIDDINEYCINSQLNRQKKRGRPKINRCTKCNSMFSTAYSLARHVNNNTCSRLCIRQREDLPLNNTEIQAIADAVILTMGKPGSYQPQLDDKKVTNNAGMLQEGGNNNNMTINNHNESITNNNTLLIKEIHINPLGKEDLSHLTQDAIINILNQGTNAVPALTKAILDIPENRNIVIHDKRNKKATVVNRDGEVEIMELKKAITMLTTDNVDRVDNYYETYKAELPKQNKSLQRMKRAHGLNSDSEASSNSDESEGESYNTCFNRYMDKVENHVELNKKPALKNMNKFKDQLDIRALAIQAPAPVSSPSN